MMIYKGFVDSDNPIHQEWIDIEEVSMELPIAIIASEDQRFLDHNGFDFGAIKNAIEHNKVSSNKWGASTLSQQLAKNLFLFPTKSFLRKGFEAYYTLLMELILDKKRIVELYINVVEFGEGIYGVKFASEHFYRKSPNELNEYESAMLATALPNPLIYSVQNPSSYMIKRNQWIRTQIRNLGGRSLIQHWYD